MPPHKFYSSTAEIPGMPGAGPNAEQQPSQIHPIDRREDISATAARVLHAKWKRYTMKSKKH
jgi:hypothetical protein